jgi:dynein heavy chain
LSWNGNECKPRIYGTFLNGHLKHFNADCQELGTKLIQAALANHEKVVASFRKTAVNFHYEFTAGAYTRPHFGSS